jgi:glycosyltransferase involved in cell wall biosynthesis
LHSQTYPLDLIEVIVVADSCIDDSLAMLQDYKAPFKQQAIEVNCRSAAIARNTGAASATRQLLLFLDDIEALPPLVESHARIHRERPGSAVMGPYPPKLQGGTRFFDVEVRLWWEEKFYQMSRIVFCAIILRMWLYYKKKSISGAGSIFSQMAWD